MQSSQIHLFDVWTREVARFVIHVQLQVLYEVSSEMDICKPYLQNATGNVFKENGTPGWSDEKKVFIFIFWIYIIKLVKIICVA